MAGAHQTSIGRPASRAGHALFGGNLDRRQHDLRADVFDLPFNRAARPILLRLSSFWTSMNSSPDFLLHPITMLSIGARA